MSPRWGLTPKLTDCLTVSRNVTLTLTLSSELSRKRERQTSTNSQLSDSNKNMVVSPRWVLYTKTDWPTDRRS
jgi:hypothetical protein